MPGPTPADLRARFARPDVTAPTRAALRQRLDDDPRFGAPRALSPAELRTLGAVLAWLLPPFPDFPARPAAEDIAAALDRRLADGERAGNGWRYDALPPDVEAYRRALRVLGEDFAQRPFSERDERLRALAAGELDAAGGFPAARWWEELRADAVERLAADPFVQAAIGYDGFADANGWPADASGDAAIANDSSSTSVGGPSTSNGTPARGDLRRFAETDVVDAVVIGTGAGGGPLLMRLARAGLTVVALEAGKRWEPARDFATDEVAQAKLFWTDERLSAGADPVPFGNNNSGIGVGGSTLHYTAYTPRPQPDDFRLGTEFGLGRDWPLTHADLEPYFDELETFLGVSGPSPYPWGPPRRRGYALAPLPLNAAAGLMQRAGAKLGLRTAPAPNAALSAPYFQPGVGWRAACTNRGFCQAGCSVGAKASVDVIFLPPALAAGAELRTECFVTGLERDGGGRLSGVVYRDADGHEHHQRARHVFLCAGAIETPRLLLFNELANGSGQVGRNFMAHTGLQVWGTFPGATRPWRGIPGGLISEDTHRPPDADFAGGYLLQSIGVMPVTYATQLARGRPDLHGPELGAALRDYPHVAGINILGECLPSPANFLELSDEPDARGHLPKPRVHFTAGPNEQRMTTHAGRTMRALWETAGARDLWSFPRFAHTLGTCRMGTDPADSVIDADGRAWDVPGLTICDNSTFPSALAVNPALTQMALSLHTADRHLHLLSHA